MKIFRKLSIKSKLFLSLLLISLICFTFTLTIGYYRTQQIMQYHDETIKDIDNYFQKESALLNNVIYKNNLLYYIDFEKKKLQPIKIPKKKLNKFYKITLFTFIINKNGKVIHIMQKNNDTDAIEYFQINRNLLSSPNLKIRKIIKEIINSKTDGILPLNIKNKKHYLYYDQIKKNQWEISILPEEYVAHEIINLENTFDKMLDSNMKSFDKMAKIKLTYWFFAYIIIFIIIIFIARYLSKSFTKPIVKLNNSTKKVGDGDFFFKVKINTGDEIEDLANNFNSMSEKLQIYVKKLNKTLSEKHAIESEIAVASKIQKSLLPRENPNFSSEYNIDVLAYLNPGAGVSGDFYDFFFLDKERLFFSIGDVVGEGIPAALFMIIVKTLLKSNALKKLPPSEIFENVNKILVHDNYYCMFATVFCGILNTKTGELVFSNAGHLDPIIKNNGDFKFLPTFLNPVIGIDEKIVFKEETIALLNNDILLLYTDGVTEAKNSSKELFSSQRLLNILNSNHKGNLEDIIDLIKSEVKSFAKEIPQSDDVTMLSMRTNFCESQPYTMRSNFF